MGEWHRALGTHYISFVWRCECGVFLGEWHTKYCIRLHWHLFWVDRWPLSVTLYSHLTMNIYIIDTQYPSTQSDSIMSTELGKRKAPPSPPSKHAANEHQEMFISVPQTCWELIASFATPPSVYNLALSSKHFFNTSTTVDAAHDAKPAKATRRSTRVRDKAKSGDANLSSAPLLATHLLRCSLLSSLGRVLEHTESGITLESALALGDLPEGSALIAGSTIAQACLGVLWEGRRDKPDVDIFCTAKAAPDVRSVSDV